MSGAVAFVFGLCALSFAAGCVLTAVMLRREQPPEAVPEPVPAEVPERPADVRWPPEDYSSKPIHRNPVMGILTALPTPEPSRPALVLVPGLEPEVPVKQDEVRRMHVVRDAPEPATTLPDPTPPDATPVDTAALDRTPLEPITQAEPTAPEEHATPEEPDLPVEQAEPVEAVVQVEPAEQAPADVVEQAPAQPRPPEPITPPGAVTRLPDASEFRQRYLRTFEAARRKSDH